MRKATSRQPGFALVEFIGLERYKDESLRVLVSRVPCVGEHVQIESDAPQKVTSVYHQLHPTGVTPDDETVDAVVKLSVNASQPVRRSMSIRWG